MNPSQLFEVWAPPSVVWSRWAKPVLFAESGSIGPSPPSEGSIVPPLNLRPDPKCAVILDLPSATSVKVGLALAEAGFRPVPLFNGNRGPQVLSSALVDNDAILASLLQGAVELERLQLPFDAPPVFLLDSRRRPLVSLTPGRFDNRWIVFPQDFPSANFLKSQGIVQALLIQEDPNAQPQEDLAHVLKRWQEAGLPVSIANVESANHPRALEIQRPSHFRSLWYAALALVGLRRNSAGGFGSVIPQPSSGG
jgi:hypothetical protein